jgi:hypothetical protein
MKMKSKKNLTRFTYETTAFQGWRVSIGRKGTVFTKYFSEKKYGGPLKAKRAAESCLTELKDLVDNSRLVNNKLSKVTKAKAQAILKAA